MNLPEHSANFTEIKFSRLDEGMAKFFKKRANLEKEELEQFEIIVKFLFYRLFQGDSCIIVDKKHQELLKKTNLVSEQNKTPFILESNRLYIYRYWNYENRLARQIKKMAGISHSPKNIDALLNRYFPHEQNQIDCQRKAAKGALLQRFTIITGGPGTGKTTTIVKILALFQELHQQQLHIALVAPTGKAAMRLQESIAINKPILPCSSSLLPSIPQDVKTIHRLLGPKPPTPYFKHNAANPLIHDLVVVDEASMVDLALMSKLIDALKPNTRIILLGDKDQLASVESGAVLADLTSSLINNTRELIKSYRFNQDIKEFASKVKENQGKKAWQMLRSNSVNSIGLLENDIIGYIIKKYKDYIDLVKTDADFKDIILAFNSFRVLCSHRTGKRSVQNINHNMVERLKRKTGYTSSGLWYPGRPVMVTQNNSSLQLYNGDIGICLAHGEQKDLMVFFEQPNGDVKKYLPSRLPQNETVFAMTIHKSQGSEFEEVLIALPEQDNPLLTRELIYTAITRAKKTIKFVTSEKVFTEAVSRNIERNSGLVEKILGCENQKPE